MTAVEPSSSIDSTLHPKQRRFLAAFEACSSILKAARWAKVHRSNHYQWLEGPAYAAAFQQAERRASRTLEDEAVRRAAEGLRKPVWYKGKIVGYETEYSDTLLVTLLKANNPDKFRDRSSSDVNLKGDVTIKRVLGVPDDAI